jgi:hypothetical protein
VRGGANTAQRFGISVAAYQGKPKNIEQLWARRHELALTVAEKELDLDNDPATWQKLDVSTSLPTEANFLILSMRSILPDGADPATAFPGDYGDLVDCFLVKPLAPASTSP